MSGETGHGSQLWSCKLLSREWALGLVSLCISPSPGVYEYAVATISQYGVAAGARTVGRARGSAVAQSPHDTCVVFRIR